MSTVVVSVRSKLHNELRKIAEEEDLEVAELIDHILRSYVEAWPFEDEDDEDEDEGESDD